MCDVYVDPAARPNDLKEVARQLYLLSVNAALGGVKYDAALLKQLFDGEPLPEFVPGTEPELAPISLSVRKDKIDEYSLSTNLVRALTNSAIIDVRINGRSIRLSDELLQ